MKVLSSTINCKKNNIFIKFNENRKQQVSTQTAVQKQALLTHTSNHLSLTQKLSSYTSETQESTHKKTTLLSEKARLTTRKESLVTTNTEKTTLHKQLQKDLDTLEKQRLKLTQKETETTEKLNQITLQLSTARTSVSIHEKRKKYLETLDALKRLFPGVHGRMMDLCSPSAKKYETSVGIVLGKNMDSIVVDNFEVGKRCLEVPHLEYFIFNFVLVFQRSKVRITNIHPSRHYPNQTYPRPSPYHPSTRKISHRLYKL